MASFRPPTENMARLRMTDTLGRAQNVKLRASSRRAQPAGALGATSAQTAPPPDRAVSFGKTLQRTSLSLSRSSHEGTRTSLDAAASSLTLPAPRALEPKAAPAPAAAAAAPVAAEAAGEASPWISMLPGSCATLPAVPLPVQPAAARADASGAAGVSGQQPFMAAGPSGGRPDSWAADLRPASAGPAATGPAGPACSRPADAGGASPGEFAAGWGAVSLPRGRTPAGSQPRRSRSPGRGPAAPAAAAAGNRVGEYNGARGQQPPSPAPYPAANGYRGRSTGPRRMNRNGPGGPGPRQPTRLELAVQTARVGTGEIQDVIAMTFPESHRPVDPRIATSLITRCANEGDWRRAEEVFFATEAVGVEHNTYTYSALINAYARGRQLGHALELFRRMKAAGVTANVVTYSTLITACEKTGMWERALETFSMMTEAGVVANLTTFNSLISACEKGAQWEQALEVHKWMLQQGLVPDVYTFSALISACEKGGQWELALQLYKRMQDAGVEANVVTYSALISACAKGGQPAKAEIVFDLMRAKGVEPNTTTYNAMICAWDKGGRLDRALAALAEMQEARLQPDTITYSSLISACEKAGELQMALRLFAQMMDQGVPANSITYSSLLEVAGASGEQEKAVQIYDWAFSAGLYSNFTLDFEDPNAYKIDLHGLSEVGAKVATLSWLRRLTAAHGRGLLISSNHSYAHIITGWGKHNADGQSKVKEAVWNLLTSELGPPLKCWIPEDNVGVILCTTRDLYAWLIEAADLQACVPSLCSRPRKEPPAAAPGTPER